MTTIEKRIELYKTVDKLLQELEEKKHTIPKALYKYERKSFLKYAKEQSKLIDKEEKIQKRLEKESK